MLIQATQVPYLSDMSPVRASQNGWSSKKQNHMIRAPFAAKQNPQWSMSTGTSNNEFKRHERYRYRF